MDTVVQCNYIQLCAERGRGQVWLRYPNPFGADLRTQATSIFYFYISSVLVCQNTGLLAKGKAQWLYFSRLAFPSAFDSGSEKRFGIP